MTKSELITRLASRFPQLTRADIDVAVKTILDAMSDRLAAGGRIEVRGFGSFNVVTRPPRIGRNPKTGESVSVPAKQAPHFKAGVDLRDRINAQLDKAKKAA